MAKKNAKNKNKKKQKYGLYQQIMGVLGLLAAIIFLPTTIVLMFGMIPTVVAAVVDRNGRGTVALTVGAMNLAGCTPFLIDMWTKSHTPDMAVTIITDPRNMVVIYGAAAIGYMIDWAMSGIVSTIMLQNGRKRVKDIEKRKEELRARWGPEVAGDIPLDPNGFPLEEDIALEGPSPKRDENKKEEKTNT